MAEQKRIAAQLAEADGLRRKRALAIELGDGLLAATFSEMFGNPVTNARGWERARVCELGDVVTGNTPPRERAEYYGNDVEWIKSDNISLLHPHPSRAAECLSAKGAAVGRCVDAGALLLTCIAGSETSIGNVVLADRRVAFNQQISAVIPHSETDPLFLYGLFRTVKPLIQRSTTLAMKRMITKGRLEELMVVRPPIAGQRQFAEKARHAEQLRRIQCEALRQAEYLYQGLLQRTFGM